MDLKVNKFVDAIAVHDNRMCVTISGGKDDDRAVLQDVIFNALEGAGFRSLDYAANAYSNTPAPEVKSMLDAMKESNPGFFDMDITVETVDRIYDTNNGLIKYPDEVEAYQSMPDPEETRAAWERAQRTAANEPLKTVEIIGGNVVIRF